jgi:Ca2+-binding EF-hand superfamily protein
MYTYGYSIAFILLYPIGIPVIMNLACRRNGIVSIVTKKMELAKFNAMISLFVKDSTSLEAQRVARLIGNTEGDENEFQRQTKREFDKLCQKQGGGAVILVDKLIQSAQHNHGAEGTTIEDLCKFFLKFDENGDGKVDLSEFQTMVMS